MNSTDREALAPVWATDEVDHVGNLAIALAAQASSMEEEHGEWTWRDIAQAALSRPSPSGEDVERLRKAWQAVKGEFGGAWRDYEPDSNYPEIRDLEEAIAALSLPHKNGEVGR